MIMQAVESQAVESGERSRLSAGQVQRVVSEAARLYFESRRSRVNAFVERHFSLAGSLALHRKALGWDVIRAPVNVALAVPYIGAKLTAKLLTDRFREAHPETPKPE